MQKNITVRRMMLTVVLAPALGGAVGATLLAFVIGLSITLYAPSGFVHSVLPLILLGFPFGGLEFGVLIGIPMMLIFGLPAYRYSHLLGLTTAVSYIVAGVIGAALVAALVAALTLPWRPVDLVINLLLAAGDLVSGGFTGYFAWLLTRHGGAQASLEERPDRPAPEVA
jgi:hypothetical protein